MKENRITLNWQNLIGRSLMILAAIGALFAFVSSIATIKTATTETLWVEIWRSVGFLVFTGMFGLLAWRPRNSAGIWELVFLHKVTMAVVSVFLPYAAEARMAGSIDGILALMLLSAYLLTRGWMSWKTFPIKSDPGKDWTLQE